MRLVRAQTSPLDQPEHAVVSRLRVALVAIGFVIASSPVIYRDNAGAFSITMSIYLVVVLIVSKGRMLGTVSLVAFLAWAALSASWTSDAAGTSNDLVALGTSVVAGFVLATLGTKTVARGLLWGSGAAVVASLTLGLLSSRYGRSVEFGGALTGIYAHRNFMAAVAVLCLALCLAHVSTATRVTHRVATIALLGLTAAAIAMTFSSSAIAIAVVLLLAFVVVWLVRSLGPLARLGIIPITLVLVLGVGVPALVRAVPDLTASVGRDTTFTGRTEIWNIVEYLVAQRPLIGYGWGGVWDGDVGRLVRQDFGYETARSAHNGALDVLLQVGWVGLILLGIAIVAALVRSARLAAASPASTWMLLALIAVLVNSFSESQIARPLGTFIVAVVAATSLLELRKHRRLAPNSGLQMPMALAGRAQTQQAPRRTTAPRAGSPESARHARSGALQGWPHDAATHPRP